MNNYFLEDDSSIKVELIKSRDGSVALCVANWSVVTLLPNGKLKRTENIGKDSCLQVDSEGRILLQDE